MQLDLKVNNLGRAQDLLRTLGDSAVRQAHAGALNDVAKQVRADMQAEMRRAFTSPTPWVVNSPWYEPATPERLSVAILPTRRRDKAGGTGGKQGVDPQKILQAQEFGGQRRDKKSEVRLRQAGLLPAGYQTAIPREPLPGSTDKYGNLSGTFIQGLISYLQAYQPGQGFRGNMSRAARERVHRFGRSNISKRAQQQAGASRGRRYFVAGTQLQSRFEGGEHKLGPVTRKGTAHLQPGIWAVVGTGKLQPVLVFVRTPSYSPRLGMERIYNKSNRVEYFERRMRRHLYTAAGV